MRRRRAKSHSKQFITRISNEYLNQSFNIKSVTMYKQPFKRVAPEDKKKVKLLARIRKFEKMYHLLEGKVQSQKKKKLKKLSIVTGIFKMTWLDSSQIIPANDTGSRASSPKVYCLEF